MIYLEFHVLLASCFIFIHYPSLPEAEAQEMLVPSEEPLAVSSSAVCWLGVKALELGLNASSAFFFFFLFLLFPFFVSLSFIAIST